MHPRSPPPRAFPPRGGLSVYVHSHRAVGYRCTCPTGVDPVVCTGPLCAGCQYVQHVGAEHIHVRPRVQFRRAVSHRCSCIRIARWVISQSDVMCWATCRWGHFALGPLVSGTQSLDNEPSSTIRRRFRAVRALTCTYATGLHVREGSADMARLDS